MSRSRGWTRSSVTTRRIQLPAAAAAAAAVNPTRSSGGALMPAGQPSYISISTAAVARLTARGGPYRLGRLAADTIVMSWQPTTTSGHCGATDQRERKIDASGHLVPASF